MTPTSTLNTFGFLPYVKPVGMTSRDLVNRVQRRLRREMNCRKLKVGHTGTLDPLADGLVVIAVGSGARLTPWMLQHAKRYLARFELGVSSISGDLEEPTTPLVGAPQPSTAEIQRAVQDLHGWIDQTPPAHSAIWVDGKRAHERARLGEDIEMPTRRVWIDSIELVSYEYPHLVIDVRCGSGTYLRSLGMDIARRCGSVAVMTGLTRTEVGPFHIQAAVAEVPPNDPPPENLEQLSQGLTPMGDFTELRTRICSPMSGLGHMPCLTLSAEDRQRVCTGLPVTGVPKQPPEADLAMTGFRAESITKPFGEHGQTNAPPEECIAVDAEGRLVGVLRMKLGQWAPYRVFQSPD
ncbi:tRNA pseudouridine(55) synthase TruB [Aporhodopirellula aestuarii]|uniref:tRNA pseudouridine synthase B n=1 Tax=Aporhodopirellula aestuarii TaxID=2950107 RepID=A0ABT0U815_9BACT|nr:tRNA pseudouridine(55) synthase TruB [Aporhodopirellula aestuarii]MCM2373057.1 tRNA pseudouridine(55) synthase TruB [Aporhodopirellula aestuarii]